ncbi:hypothetical protein MYCTH_2111641 [Thermothelomyces thermophilus ATCC 42464]|uniref:Uncharacterized protein n=1 Tax=Thermothelomyces thermophilus (strain ATCC 42464 / BCRC 31852 / DSM 1799) TaxID=573729 RepID=G2QGV0_THET4|nr:uncharacterized protein MYCTH_2111641 [Thermothelomyces thermophilus ATCC 42464]AEO59457.1 hypothetical protein MYCTH_2111641 [Thermothelomyces thermophilus ATCC 42464]
MGGTGAKKELPVPSTTVALSRRNIPLSELAVGLTVLGCVIIFLVGAGVLWFRRSRLERPSQQVDVELQKANDDAPPGRKYGQPWIDAEYASFPRVYQPGGSYNNWKQRRDAREQRHRHRPEIGPQNDSERRDTQGKARRARGHLSFRNFNM